MREKLLILEPLSFENLQKIEKVASKYCEVQKISLNASALEKQEAIKNASFIIGQPPVTEITKQLAPNLKWIQMTNAGTDMYTIRKLFQKERFPQDVLLTNATGAFGACIAEYMVGAILSMYFRFPIYKEQQKQGLWKKQPNMQSLEGKTVLILGAGNIGTEFAKRMKAFQTYTIGVRRTIHEYPDCFDEMHTIDEIDKLLGRADIVACSLPYTRETKGMLDRQRFYQMKQGSILVNVGRGNLIVMDDLHEVMENGYLGGAILDVTNPEPLPTNHPLWYNENVFITPHISGQSLGQSEKTEERITDICCRNIKNYFEGNSLENIVDFEKGYAK